jgi:hypothetical protein
LVQQAADFGIFAPATDCMFPKKGRAMAILSVSYDLYKEPGRVYEKLIAVIKSCTSWCHPVESTWYVDTSLSPIQLLEKLKSHLHAKDKIIITPVTVHAGWVTQGLPEDVLMWIKQRLTRPKATL